MGLLGEALLSDEIRKLWKGKSFLPDMDRGTDVIPGVAATTCRPYAGMARTGQMAEWEDGKDPAVGVSEQPHHPTLLYHCTS